jgi:RsiW-degrading membrane proteinase PrsW (M82 family)
MEEPSSSSSIDRLSLSAEALSKEPVWTRRERDVLVAAMSLAVLGIGGLWLFVQRVDRAWARPIVFLSVLAASLGPAIAALLLVAPRRSAVRLRHFVAGVVAAWACIELAGAARRMGIAPDSGAFRAAWAPVTEELLKALVLGAMMTASDRDNDRRAIATAGVAVGAGFAFRENVVYFATAATGEPLPIEWLVLRAIPPVFAHTLFGATYGTILAQAAINRRALELNAPRLSWVALLLATMAHVAYNAIPWAVLTEVPQYAIPFVVGWTLLALAGTWAISRRVRWMSHDDPPLSARVSIAADRSGAIDHSAAVVAAVLLAMWALPLAVPRYLAVVFTPFALGTLALLSVSTALRVDRGFVWLLLGIAARPFFSMSEAALSAIPVVLGPSIGGAVAGALGSMLWALAAVVLGARVGASRGARTALVAGVGLAAGMVAASIGGNLAAAARLAPWREMLATTLRLFPRTIALSATLAWLGATRPRLALALALATGIAAVGADWLVRIGHFWAAIPLAVASIALLVAIVMRARRAE